MLPGKDIILNVTEQETSEIRISENIRDRTCLNFTVSLIKENECLSWAHKSIQGSLCKACCQIQKEYDTVLCNVL